ncbi:MAG: glutathione S-transferase C-terminal domain-containing protein [Pseudomonadota bacterium]
MASRSCPWSHRVLLFRAIKGLDAVLPCHIAGGPRVQGYRVSRGKQLWRIPGTETSIEHLHELYAFSDPEVTTRATVPVLWDAAEHRILSNDSTQILCALDAAKPAAAAAADWTLLPDRLRDDIDAMSGAIQSGLANAVYRAGKAQRQEIYDTAVNEVFATLDALEDRLSTTRYLHGPALTATDLRLWPALARFDLVYHGHFKCSRRRLVDYPNLWAYARDILTWPGVEPTFDPDAIRAAYYGEDRDLNPAGVVAIAPDCNWFAWHGRDRLGDRQVWGRNAQLYPVGANGPVVP